MENPVIEYSELKICQGNKISELRGKKRFDDNAEKIKSKL